MVALLFPGQGSQSVGMGRELVADFRIARETFAEADEVLGEPLAQLMFEGPEDRLQLTENAQPAILTMSVAVWRVLREARPALTVTAAAGHSLGEYSALVAAGVLSFADALRAVRVRGRAMQSAVPVGRGAMSAVVGLEATQVLAGTAEVSTVDEPVGVAAINAPDQVTISGSVVGIERATTHLRERGARKVRPLGVSAPFHCALMAPVEAPLAEALAEVALGSFSFPVVSNVTARSYEATNEVRPLLLQQLTAPVRWVESMQALAALGVRDFVELGAGKTLAGLSRKIDATWRTLAVYDPATLAAAVAEF